MNKGPDKPNTMRARLNLYINTLRTLILSKFSEAPILKGIAILGSGAAISQVLGIIFVPIITRIYPPEIYGTLAVFGSLLSILIVGGALRYEITIPLPEKDDDAEYLFILSLFIVGIFTIILFVILTIWGDYLAGIFHFEFIKPYYWLFCIAFFGISLYDMLMYWALRSKDYFRITQTRITQGICGSVSKIILGLLSFGSFGLILGEIINRIVGIGTLGRTILPKIWLSLHDVDFHKLRSLAYQYRRFPVFSFPAGFINEIALQAPTLFLSTIFGFQTVGLFALSISILALPLSFISGSISHVYTAESSELFRHKSEETLTLYLNTTKKLFMFGAPIIMTGAIISPILFPIVFGSAWKDAGMFVLPLSFYLVAQFVVSSTDRLEMYGYNHWELAWNISRTVSVLSGFYIAILFNLSAIATILLFSLIMTVMYVICYFLNVKAIKLALKKIN